MKKKSLYIAMISYTIWALCVCFGYVSYDVNDDAGMNMAAAGAYGCFSQYLVYTNVVLGYLIKFMYVIFPGVNCYLWFYLITDLIAIIVLAVSFSEKLSLKQSVVMTVFLNLLLAGDFYIHIHYSKSAVLYVVSASIYLIVLTGRGRKLEIGAYILATILFVLGFCVRIQSFESVLPFILVAFTFSCINDNNKKWYKKGFLFMIPLLASIMCFFINYHAYYMTEWRDFKVSDDIMIKIRDFGMYSYDQCPEKYDAEGITENDFNMILHWMWNDPEEFNEMKLRKLDRIGKESLRSGAFWSSSAAKGTIKEFVSRVNNRSIAGLLIAIILLSLLVGNKKLIIQNTLLFGIAFIEYYYLILKGRFFWRVEIIIWLAAVLLCGYFLIAHLTERVAVNEVDIGRKCRMTSAGIFAVLIVTCVFIKSEVFDNSRYTNGDNEYGEFQTILQANSHFVMYNVADYGMLMGAKNIFDIDCKYLDYYKNITEMGASGNSPSGRYFAKQKKIDNPAKALFECDDVYFVGDSESKNVLLSYLEEKYGPGITVHSENVDGVMAWKFDRD